MCFGYLCACDKSDLLLHLVNVMNVNDIQMLDTGHDKLNLCNVNGQQLLTLTLTPTLTKNIYIILGGLMTSIDKNLATLVWKIQKTPNYIIV